MVGANKLDFAVKVHFFSDRNGFGLCIGFNFDSLYQYLCYLYFILLHLLSVFSAWARWLVFVDSSVVAVKPYQ